MDEFLDQIIQGDVIKTLKKIPDESIDLIFTDPPYGITNSIRPGREANPDYHLTHAYIRAQAFNFEEWDKFENQEEFFRWTWLWLDEAIRVLKSGRMIISYFDKGQVNFLSKYLTDRGFLCRGYYADCKQNPAPQVKKYKWMGDWEIIGLWKKPKGKPYIDIKYGHTLKDWGVRKVVRGHARFDHPTQKPIPLVERFIRYGTREGEIVLDPFIGSGTTALAAKYTNRRFIGIEKQEKYVNLAQERLKQSHITYAPVQQSDEKEKGEVEGTASGDDSDTLFPQKTGSEMQM